jgi:hypothetical protein
MGSSWASTSSQPHLGQARERSQPGARCLYESCRLGSMHDAYYEAGGLIHLNKTDKQTNLALNQGLRVDSAVELQKGQLRAEPEPVATGTGQIPFTIYPPRSRSKGDSRR